MEQEQWYARQDKQSETCHDDAGLNRKYKVGMCAGQDFSRRTG
jgi:hypothetical protein